MSVYGKRGAYIFAAFGIVFSVYMLIPGGKTAALVCACALPVIFICLTVIKSKRRLGAIIAAVLCFISAFSGFFLAGSSIKGIASDKLLCDGKEHTVTARVDKQIYEKQFGSAYYVTAQSIDGEKSKTGIYLEITYLGDFDSGAEILFTSVFSAAEGDEADIMKSKGIFITGESDDVSVVSADGKLTLPQKINLFFNNIFHNMMPEEEADFASTVFLGNRGLVERKTGLSFRRSGASHLLALSGLHLSVIALGFDFLLKALKMRKQLRIVIMITAITAFAFITGLSASVFRASVMLILYYVSQLFGEEKDSLTALLFSLMLIFAVRPYAVWDAGLWMSFSATLGLVVFSDVLIPKFAPATRETYSGIKIFFRNAARYFIGLFTANIIATLFTLPVTYLVFGGISLISPLSNLILVPLVQLILYLLFILCATFYIPFFSTLVAFAAEKLISLSERLATAFSSIEKVYISTEYPFTPYIIGALILCIIALVFIPAIKKRYIYAAAAVACVAFACCLGIYSKVTTNDLRAVCVNNKENDAIGMVYRGKSIIIDVSAGGFQTVYETVSDTSGYAAEEIDALVLTHLHKNHIRSIEKLTGYVKINRIVLPTSETDNDAEILAAIIETAEENDIRLDFYNRRSESYLDFGELTVSLPEYITLKRSTHPVICFSIYLGEKEMLLYAGSSLREACGNDIFADARAVIFGAHGPVEKSVPDVSLCENAEHIIFSGDDIYALAGEPEYAEAVSKRGGKLTILIKE